MRGWSWNATWNQHSNEGWGVAMVVWTWWPVLTAFPPSAFPPSACPPSIVTKGSQALVGLHNVKHLTPTIRYLDGKLTNRLRKPFLSGHSVLAAISRQRLRLSLPWFPIDLQVKQLKDARGNGEELVKLMWWMPNHKGYWTWSDLQNYIHQSRANSPPFDGISFCTPSIPELHAIIPFGVKRHQIIRQGLWPLGV